jgi:hypothetical protein
VTLDIQWWQALIGIVVALGLSPAPWILGLATGKIQFASTGDKMLATLKEAHALLVTSLKDAAALAVTTLREAHSVALAELAKHYGELASAKDQAYAEMKESRDYYRRARLEERDRADKVTDQLAESTELAKLAVQFLSVADEAAKDGRS